MNFLRHIYLFNVFPPVLRTCNSRTFFLSFLSYLSYLWCSANAWFGAWRTSCWHLYNKERSNPRSIKGFSYRPGADIPSSSGTRPRPGRTFGGPSLLHHTYIHGGGSDSFLGVVVHLNGLFFGFAFTYDWCSQVVWLGVTGLRYRFSTPCFSFGGVFSKMVGDFASAFLPRALLPV